MTTREEMVEACAIIGPLCANAHPQWDQKRSAAVTLAAAQLTRDGELRERLAALVDEWRKLWSER